MSYDMIFYNMILLYYIMILYKYLLGVFEQHWQNVAWPEAEGNIIVPKGLILSLLPEITVNICFVIITNKPIKKDGIENFLSSTQNSQLIFLHKVHFQNIIGIKWLLLIFCRLYELSHICSTWFYFIYNSSQILIFVMIANSCIARLLFTCFD